jgi:hypothetical protein
MPKIDTSSVPARKRALGLSSSVLSFTPPHPWIFRGQLQSQASTSPSLFTQKGSGNS